MAPRDGSGIYHRPVGTDAVPDTTIESSKYNTNVADVEQDLNTPRPIVAGGTGASSADQARQNLFATRWNPYTGSGQSFVKGDITRDGDWTMVANKNTSDRPAPQASGTEEDLLPPWTPTTQSARATYTVYNEWTVNTAGWIDQYGGDVLSANVGATHTITLSINGTVKDTFTSAPVTAQLYWHDITPIVVASGAVIRVTVKVTQVSNNNMYWQQQSALFTTAPVYCSLAVGSKDAGTADATAYGCHVMFIPGTSSPDWDVLAFGGAGAGGAVSQAVLYAPQTLLAADQTQARQNIYAAPFDALAYNGMQINGSCEVSQERGTTGFVPVVSTWTYLQDGWRFLYGTAPLSISVWPADPASLPGFRSRITITATTGKATLAAGDQIILDNVIEGYRISRLGWGNSNAQPLSIGFYVQATIAGTMTVTVFNGANANRGYSTNVTINSPNTWEYKTLTVPGDTAGSWATDNTFAMSIRFCFGAGTSNQGVAGSWQATVSSGTSSTTNFCAATNNIILVTGLIVLPGIELPSAARAPLIMRPYDQELLTCQRYYIKPSVSLSVNAYGAAGGGQTFVWWTAPVSMRASATIISSWTGGVNATASGPAMQADNRTLQGAITSAATSYYAAVLNITSLDARL